MIRFSFLLLLGVLCLGRTAQADIVNDFVRVDCNKMLNYLAIDGINVNGWLPRNMSKKHEYDLFAEHGLVAVDQLFTFNKDFTEQTPKQFQTSCTLDLKDDADENETHKPEPVTYDITLEGYAENSHPGGECGGFRSYSVTIKQGDRLIIDHIPAHTDCGESPVLGVLQIVPHEGYINAGAPDAPNTLWLMDNDLPLTKSKIYKEKIYRPEPE